MKREEVWDEEKEALVSELEQLQQGSQEESGQDRVLELEELNSQLTEDLSQANDLLRSLREENAVLSNSLTVRTEEVAGLEASNVQLQEDLNTTTDRVALVQEEKNQLSESLAEKTEEVARLTSEDSGTAADKIASLREENAQLSEILATKTEEVAHLETSNAQMIEDLDTAADKVTSLQEENAQLSGNLESEEEENLKLKSELDKTKNVSKNLERVAVSILLYSQLPMCCLFDLCTAILIAAAQRERSRAVHSPGEDCMARGTSGQFSGVAIA